MNFLSRTRALYFNYIALLLSSFFNNYFGSSVQLQSSNIEHILRNNELVFLNFYADWCRFSQILTPIYDEAATKIKEEFPQEGKIVFGKVDCDRESTISSQYHVSKYPTLKLIRYGQLTKREYRGQRSVDALVGFIREQLKDNIQRVPNMDDLDNIDRKKRHVIGYFDSEQNNDFANYQKVSSMLRDDCQFYAAVGEMSASERIAGNKLVYRPTNVDHSDIPYTGSMADYSLLQAWATDKCVPLVREITFENAEELTEEGLPFLILFHHPDDHETADAFRRIVSRELITDKNSINCLTADGVKFSHPLYHLGKTTNDLPILAIDSFRHMYLWPHNAKADVEKPGLLKQFIADLHSGKLHREFHHGPDPTAQDGDSNALVQQGDTQHQHVNVQQMIIMSKDGVALQVVRVVQAGPHNHNKVPLKVVNDHVEKEENKRDAEVNEVIEEVDLTEVKDEEYEDSTVGTEEEGDNDEGTDTPSATPGLALEEPKFMANPRQEGDNLVMAEETKTIRIPQDRPVTTAPPTPPQSMFRQLFPSRQRYTILRDEL